ncbi:hypothetical protein GCM10011503_07800 [Henriciella pelagia]|uniref:Uncharacterized protein n=1 Tax=Henriciella pelagia TaxID=1977912 RepID=A0ABQ1J9Q0_9PROT|nr:hypothetical protein GCM10011503_07800 [Henriciella pelagia]
MTGEVQEAEADGGRHCVEPGNGELTGKLHRHLDMVESCIVGATHWEKRGVAKDLPGARPTFFFAPAQIAKRNKE